MKQPVSSINQHILGTEDSIRYVALGDSLSEGMGDPDPTRPNGLRGWCDRVAEQFMLADPGACYANLAIRGRLLGPIIDEQLQAAIDLKPNLVSLIGGGNDALRPNFNPDALATRYADAFTALRAEGIAVFTFTGFDPGTSGYLNRNRPRVALMNELLREVADDHGVTIVDYWRLRTLHDWRYWAPDRLHMNAAGHTVTAKYVLETLSNKSLTVGDPQLPELVTKTKIQEAKDNAVWAKEFLVPWIGRRLRGTSSGDSIIPRFPQWTRFEEAPEL